MIIQEYCGVVCDIVGVAGDIRGGVCHFLGKSCFGCQEKCQTQTASTQECSGVLAQLRGRAHHQSMGRSNTCMLQAESTQAHRTQYDTI